MTRPRGMLPFVLYSAKKKTTATTKNRAMAAVTISKPVTTLASPKRSFQFPEDHTARTAVMARRKTDRMMAGAWDLGAFAFQAQMACAAKRPAAHDAHTVNRTSGQ